MLSKIRQLLIKYNDIVSYLFFGVLTTLVNYAVYLPLYNWAGWTAAAANGAAWVVAVLFAYVTNKLFVFESRSWGWQVIAPEFAKFIACRIGSGAAETAILWLSVDVLLWNGNLMKLLTSVLVIVLNYVGSKLLVFRKK